MNPTGLLQFNQIHLFSVQRFMKGFCADEKQAANAACENLPTVVRNLQNFELDPL